MLEVNILELEEVVGNLELQSSADHWLQSVLNLYNIKQTLTGQTRFIEHLWDRINRFSKRKLRQDHKLVVEDIRLLMLIAEKWLVA